LRSRRYHSLVRRLVLVLLLALLPLRMWAAEDMLNGMALADLKPAAASHAAMPPDCPMQAAHGPATPQDEPVGGIASCLSCQLCAAVALPPEFALSRGPAPSRPETAATPRFASAELLPDHKPPIS
jgi:hypothetical protein